MPPDPTATITSQGMNSLPAEIEIWMIRAEALKSRKEKRRVIEENTRPIGFTNVTIPLLD